MGLLQVLFLLATFLSLYQIWFILFLIPEIVFGYVAFIVTLTHIRFSEKGGDYQNKIHKLMLAYKHAQGDTVDIGCGNGNLIIIIGKEDTLSQHIGIDYWGKDWQYSLEQCRINARIEGVGNIEFIKGSAAKLKFADDRFDYVVSCLTFHEVKDEIDKTISIREALRVLKPGGSFIFLDLFDDKKYYKAITQVTNALEDSGGKILINKSLNELMELPYPLNNRRALKYARLLSGKKSE